MKHQARESLFSDCRPSRSVQDHPPPCVCILQVDVLRRRLKIGFGRGMNRDCRSRCRFCAARQAVLICCPNGGNERARTAVPSEDCTAVVSADRSAGDYKITVIDTRGPLMGGMVDQMEWKCVLNDMSTCRWTDPLASWFTR